jgi:hypothetical protein
VWLLSVSVADRQSNSRLSLSHLTRANLPPKPISCCCFSKKIVATMARRFRDSSSRGIPAAAGTSTASSPPLPAPLPDLGVALSDAELRATAYEVVVAASRGTGARPLTYIPQPASSTTVSWPLPFLQFSAAGKAKGTLGPGPPTSSSGSSRATARRTVAEHVRLRLGVTEQEDARIRRGLLRIAASQVRTPVPSKCSLPSL